MKAEIFLSTHLQQRASFLFLMETKHFSICIDVYVVFIGGFSF